MGQEEQIYALPYRSPDYITDTSHNTSMATFFCSYVDFAYDNNNSFYILNTLSELDKINSFCYYGEITFHVMVWICFILGVPGNLLAIITTSKMPKSTGTFYILVLAFWDLLAMIIRSIDSLLRFHDVVLSTSFCQFVFAMTHFTTINANWILILISVERYITVRFPLQKPFYFTLRRARISAFALACLLTPFGIVDIFALESQNGDCIHSSLSKHFYEDIWLHVIDSFYSFIPAILILIFFLLVVLAFRQHDKNIRSVINDKSCPNGGKDSTGENNFMKKQRHEAKKAEKALTKMMFFTFAVFLVVTIPVCIVLISTSSKDDRMSSPVSVARDEMLVFLTSSLTLVSHAFNFYVYFLSARKFRSRFLGLFKVFHPKKESIQESKITEVPDS